MDQTDKAKKGKKRKSRDISYLIFQIILLAVTAASTLFIYLNYISESKRNNTDLTVLENKIMGIQELAVVRQIYRDVIYTKAGSFFSSEVLFSIEYNITAGINLSRGVDISRTEDGTLIVTLPEPEILSIDADDETIEQIYIRETFRNVKQSDYMGLIIQEKDFLVKNALDSGILIKAKRNSEVLLSKLMLLSGYKDIKFQYTKQEKEE